MIKRPFLIFMTVIGLLVGGTLWFLQSPAFARVFKKVAAKYIPSDIGLETDFSELRVKLFPPGISIKNPKIAIGKRNFANLPAGSSVTAERVDLNFLPFQMFSGTIRVNELVIVKGEVNLLFDENAPAKKKSTKLIRPDFHWDELFQIHAEAIEVQNTALHLKSVSSGLSLDCQAESLRLAQWSGRGGLGYQIGVNLSEIRGSFLKKLSLPPAASQIDHLRAEASVNALGMQLESFSLKALGVELESSGSLKGNLLNPKGLLVDADVTLHGEIKKIGDVFERAKISADGDLTFNGRVNGNLDKIYETLTAKGELTVRDLKFQKWRADELKAIGSWTPRENGGGEIAISKVLLMAKELPRVAPSQPGHGGKVETGPFKINLGSREPIVVPVNLERAHLHWLAAPGVKDIYGLGFRMSGPAKVTATLPTRTQPWGIEASLGIAVIDFQLDNQKLNVPRPLHKILTVPKIKVDGTVLVDPTGLRPMGVTLTLPNSKFTAGGKVDFKNGLDLIAGGPAHLEDVGHIAESPIKGDGTVNAHIHGPPNRIVVDFDADFKKASYLNLSLGDIKGRITYDDDPSLLLFKKFQGTKYKTGYLVDGVLNLGPETADLDVKIAQGNIQDLSQIFENLTTDLWWYPRSLNGPMSAEGKISGGLSTKKLQVLARLEGSAWEYLGERFKSVQLTGGYDQGKYFVTEARAQKKFGKISGRISVDDSKQMDWSFKTHDLTIADLDHLAQLDVPMRGSILVDSIGKGKIGAIESTTNMAVTQLLVRGMAMAPSHLNLATKNGVLRASGTAVGGQGYLDMQYNFNPAAESYIRADIRQLDFSPVLLLLDPKAIQDKTLAGQVSGLVNLTFKSGEIERASGVVELTEYLLSGNGARFQLATPMNLKVSDGDFDIRDLGLKGPSRSAWLTLRGRRGEISGNISGAIDIALVQFFTPTVTQASGGAEIDLDIGGKLKEPSFSGKASIEGASVRIQAMDAPFENVSGVLQLRQNVLNVQNIQGDLSGGRVGVNGKITLFADRVPSISLRANVQGPKIKMFPFQYAKLSGALTATGEELPYLIGGNIVVESALIKEKVLGGKQGGGTLKALQYTPPLTKQGQGSSSKFKLNIEVSAERNILIQNDLFDGEARGVMTVINTLETPRVLGKAEIIEGKFFFKDRTFQIQSGTANFDNPTVINPSFDLNGQADINGIKIQLYATGRMTDPKIEFSSNPSMPADEILQLLAVGLTSSDARKLKAADQSVLRQGEAASLVLHSLDFNRDLENKTGFQLKVDESVNPQTGTSAFRPQNQTTVTAQPKIVLKKQVEVPLVKKNVTLSAGSTVGVGTGAEREMSGELEVNDNFSVIGIWNSYESNIGQSNRNSSGFDLKFQKRFK